MVRVPCPRCDGYGGEWFEEDEGAPPSWHSCYHCCEEGVVEMTEQEYCDMVNELVAEATGR